MTEMSGVCASFAGTLPDREVNPLSWILKQPIGNDYIARPKSTGIPSPINDVIIVSDEKVLKPGEVGEIWMFVSAPMSS